MGTNKVCRGRKRAMAVVHDWEEANTFCARHIYPRRTSEAIKGEERADGSVSGDGDCSGGTSTPRGSAKGVSAGVSLCTHLLQWEVQMCSATHQLAALPKATATRFMSLLWPWQSTPGATHRPWPTQLQSARLESCQAANQWLGAVGHCNCTACYVLSSPLGGPPSLCNSCRAKP